MGWVGAGEPDASEERVMETPYWMCFECEECGGPCHEVGDGKAGKYWSAVGFVDFCKGGER